MTADEDFPVPPTKRRRTSEDSSAYSPRSPRDRPTSGQEVDLTGRENEKPRTYRRSRSGTGSTVDGDLDPQNGSAKPLPYRRRTLSQTPDLSQSPRSRSRARPQSQAESYQSEESYEPPTPYPENQNKLAFKPLHTLLKAHDRGITAIRFSPDLSLLAVASADTSITIYTVSQPFDQKTPIKFLRTLRAHLAGINALAWSPIGPDYTLASASDDKSILLWSPLSSDFPISPSPLIGHSNYVYSLAFSPKGNMLVSGSYDEAVFLWDVRSARVMRTLPAHSDPVSGVDFLRDGSMVCSCAEDGLIRIWDSGTGQCLKTLVDEDRKPVTAVRFTPNGRFVLAWTLDGCIRLWRYTEGTCVKTYTGHVNKEFSLSGTVGEYMYGQEAFLVSGSEDGELVAWDVTSKEILWRGKGHEDVVLTVDYAKLRDGRGLLVSAGKDRSLRLWIEDIEPRQDVLTGSVKNGAGENDDHGGDTMLVDINIRQTTGGDVEIEENDVVMQDDT